MASVVAVVAVAPQPLLVLHLVRPPHGQGIYKEAPDKCTPSSRRPGVASMLTKSLNLLARGLMQAKLEKSGVKVALEDGTPSL